MFPRGAGTFINKDRGAETGWRQPRHVSCLLVLPDMLTPAPTAAQARHTVGAQDPGPGDSGVYTVSCIAAFHHVKLTQKTAGAMVEGCSVLTADLGLGTSTGLSRFEGGGGPIPASLPGIHTTPISPHP